MAQRIKIPSNGETTPEYVAVRVSSEDIRAAIAAMLDRFVGQAHSSGLIPSRNPRDPVMDVVLAEVSRDPINYYILQHVLVSLNVGNRFDKSIGKMDKAFLGEMRRCIPALSKDPKTEQVSHDPTKKEPDHPKVFISFSRRKPCGDSLDAHAKAKRLHTMLEGEKCEPWMDEKGLEFGDVLAEEIFPVIKHCRAIIPILTAGYATSLWCLRELYYAILQQPKKIVIPMLLEDEDNISHQRAGKWLMGIGTAQKYFKEGNTYAMIKDVKDKIDVPQA